ncbi:MAG: hypothetical protein V3S41_07165, partial [Spirochaetia bacterium]
GTMTVTIESLRLCRHCRFGSIVTKTSKCVEAKWRRSPFFMPAQPSKKTLVKKYALGPPELSAVHTPRTGSMTSRNGKRWKSVFLV